MTITRTIAFCAALLALAPTSLAAQDTSSTVAEDLTCAIFFASVIDSVQDNPEAAAGITAMMTYFIGRYEARSDTGLTEAMVQRSRELQGVELDSIGRECQRRAEALPVRMAAAGQALIEEGQRPEQ